MHQHQHQQLQYRYEPKAAATSLTFRLPKTPAAETETQEIWTRYGFISAREPSELSVSSRQLLVPAVAATAADQRRHNIFLPTFDQAVIAPVRNNTCEPQYENSTPKSWYQRQLLNVNQRPNMAKWAAPRMSKSPTVPYPSPLPPSPAAIPPPTAARSHTHQVAALPPKTQGPYSRRFIVRCFAPSTWMRMKWGRSMVT
ncbi:uncharacterized protein LOC141900575 [Tubulanus polymorphus]|uniref:uncharacterized protein LOC141900575 n=1 Tax=Tubulanus polymorphus TaxID=672921 RepID=UPI003DA65847